MKSHNINLISAISKNRTIGKEDGGLPWYIPEDFKHFKNTTIGHPIIMGRKTFELFPSLLPERMHIVVTRSNDYRIPEKFSNKEKIIITGSIEEAIKKASELDNEIFVIGGSQIYELAIPLADKLYLTLVNTDIDGPAKFPEYQNDFKKVDSQKTSDENYEYEFCIWERK